MLLFAVISLLTILDVQVTLIQLAYLTLQVLGPSGFEQRKRWQMALVFSWFPLDKEIQEGSLTFSWRLVSESRRLFFCDSDESDPILDLICFCLKILITSYRLSSNHTVACPILHVVTCPCYPMIPCCKALQCWWPSVLFSLRWFQAISKE